MQEKKVVQKTDEETECKGLGTTKMRAPDSSVATKTHALDNQRSILARLSERHYEDHQTIEEQKSPREYSTLEYTLEHLLSALCVKTRGQRIIQ